MFRDHLVFFLPLRFHTAAELRAGLVAFGVFRAVALAPGHHRVVWTCRPLTFVIGASITMIAAAWLVVAAIASFTSRPA